MSIRIKTKIGYVYLLANLCCSEVAIKIFRTKNSRERTEYLMPRTREALLYWRDHQQWMRHRKKIEKVKSDHVFCRLDGTPVKGFGRAWRNLCSIAWFEGFHFHDLRHTFCSNLLLAGSNLKDVKEMIGHSDLSMTDRYSHLNLKHKLIQQDRLAAHYARGDCVWVHKRYAKPKTKKMSVWPSG